MANIKKQFNFRNGVQVDDDNLIVTSTGLVGIGTSIPNEALDVRGNAKVVGVLTATQLNAETLIVPQSTISNITLTGSIIGSGVSIKSGVVTATTTSGLVTYFGDGRFLQGLPTSQWLDVDVGLGFTSIYAQGFVGVGTVDPRFVFQVAGTPDTSLAGFANGVGISSSGNILATGIVTASQFSGIGSNLTLINASNISSGTLNNDRLPQNINISGILTASTSITSGNINASGILTASSGLVAGNTTINGNLNATGIGTFGPLNATQLSVTGNVDVTGVGTFSGGIQGNVIGSATSLTQNATVNINDLTVGVATVSTRLYAESIGVGTNSPSSDIHIIKSSTSKLQVTSDTAEAIIAIGRSTTLTENNGALIFGNTAGIYPYSMGGNTLDVVNYDTGNINQYLDYGVAGLGTGNFNWIYGQNPTDPLMSLSYQGNLGLGITNSTNKLHVVGTSTITGDAFFGQNVNISGNTNISGNLNLLGNLNADLTGNVSGNVNSTAGISTFNDIRATNVVSSFKSFIGFTGIGLTATDPSYDFQISDHFFVSSAGIGIGTNVRIDDIGISALDEDAVFGSVGIGTTDPQSALDVNGDTIISGITTSQGGFTSGSSNNPVKITVSGNTLTFTVVGVGSTSLTLF